eukprot:g27431.t1
MKFNPDKCKVMQFGGSNLGVNYIVNGRILRNTNIQMDLGVQVHGSLKVATQVAKVIKKGCDMLAFITRGVEYKSWQNMLQRYKTLLRPHWEYCVQFWSPHYQKDVEALEK